MADEKATERKKIQVGQVLPSRKVGEYDLWEFKGKDGVTYEVWSSTLAEVVKEGAEFEAEVVHTTKVTDQATYHHHKVTQIFIDGKPVRGGKGGGSYSGYKGHSPEERRSIERQVSAKIAFEFPTTTKATVDDLLSNAEKIYQWISSPTTEVVKKTSEPTKAEKEWADLETHDDAPALPVKAKSATANSKVEKVLQYIADQMKFANLATARKWLKDGLKIDNERIDSDPEGVLKEVADLQGWNL